MKVYVAINWFYEGDSNLVDSYGGVFKSVEDLKDKIIEIYSATEERLGKAEQSKKDPNLYYNDGFEFYKTPEFLSPEDMGFWNGEITPIKEWGNGYGSASKWEIREEEI